MNVQTGDVEMHNAPLDVLQQALGLVVVHEVLHDDRRYGDELVQ